MTTTEHAGRVHKPRFRRGENAAPRDPLSGLFYGAIAWLALLGLMAITIGGHDTVAGTEITVRIWGSLVLGSGIVLVAGAAGLHRGTPVGRSLAMVGALLGAALGLLTFLAQVVTDEPDRRLVLWMAIIALSLGTAWVVRAVTPESDRGKTVWSQLPVLKTVVSAGVFISVGQFWYTSIYIPTTAPASITLDTQLSQKREGDKVIVQGTVTVKNTSSTRVSVVGSVLDVSAGNVTAGADVGEPEFSSRVLHAHEDGFVPADLSSEGMGGRYAELSDATVVSRGPLVGDGSYFEPGESVTVPFIAWVPADQFGVVTATAGFVIARSRALALEEVKPTITSAPSTTISTREIPEAGWLRRLTRGRRYVRVVNDDGTMQPPFPEVRFSPDEGQATSDDYNRRMWRFYGVNLATSNAIVPLGPEAD
jgi:hypothetical protein